MNKHSLKTARREYDRPILNRLCVAADRGFAASLEDMYEDPEQPW